MTLISSFVEQHRDRLVLHPTQVAATAYFDDSSGKRLLQIDTHGSADREIPDKVSQTIQLNEESARQLFGILQNKFGFR